MQTYMPRRSRQKAAPVQQTPSSPVRTAAPPAPDAVSEPNLEDAVHSRMAARFGPDFLSPKAEAEADSIGKQFAGAQSFDQLKEQMGERLGADFSQVRLHSGPDAAAMTKATQSKAFTSGSDIYLGSSGFNASVAAHEMVHTVQQGSVDAAANVTAAPAGAVQYKKDRPPTPEELKRWKDAALEGDRGRLTALATQDKLNESTFLGDIIKTKNDEIHQTLGQQAVDLKDRDSLREAAVALAPDTQAMMDPLFRDALSQEAPRDIPEADRAAEKKTRRAISDEIDHKLIADSMKLVSAEARGRLGKGEAEQAEQAGRNMAHLMLAMQMGKFSVNQTTKREDGTDVTTPKSLDKLEEELGYAPSMAGMISHGGRVMMDFGTSQSHHHSFFKRSTTADDVYRSMMELDDGKTGKNRGGKDLAHSTKTKRSFATHYMDYDDNGNLVEQNGNTAAASALFSSFKQRGFNPAIGGAGNIGIRSDEITKKLNGEANGMGHVIRPDGVNGHMYLGVKQSDMDKRGGMMVGLETSAAGQSNLLGKVHDAKAVKSPYSPVGGTKGDAYGDTYNGRKVDLTGLTMDEQVEVQHMLTNRLNALIKSNDATQYNAIMEQLSGSQMGEEALANLLLGPPPGNNAPEAERAKYGEKYRNIMTLIQRGRGTLQQTN